jgi:DNA primase
VKEHILRTKAAILVEGQGDVWRLSEAGIFNAVGMFGCSLSEQQRIILERSGALSLVILTDSDEAGQVGKEKIKQKCDKLFNLYFPSSSSKDVGDMKIEDIKSNLLPQIEGLV